jgi:hypothetical protein
LTSRQDTKQGPCFSAGHALCSFLIRSPKFL